MPRSPRDTLLAVSEGRNKTLADFRAVLEWVQAQGVDATVIGGVAVGAYAANVGAVVFSADLDLLTTPEQQDRLAQASAMEPRLEVVKRPQARHLPILVMRWDGLEADVLTQSAGLPEPTVAFSRAWSIEGVWVADPLDLLSNKLAVHRDKDVEHIRILRSLSEGFCLFFLESRPGRQAIEYLQRWARVEGWSSIPEDLFVELRGGAARSSPEARRYLVSKAGSRAQALAVSELAPAQEREALAAIVAARFPEF